jgi:hypothetical protein
MHRDAGRAGVEDRSRPPRTLGTLPPRELRSVAILLTLTERLIMYGSRQRAPDGVRNLFRPGLHDA